MMQAMGGANGAFMRPGFKRRKPELMQKNGAPVGYGQQDGASLYLDQPQQQAVEATREGGPGTGVSTEQKRNALALKSTIETPTDGAINNAMLALIGSGGQAKPAGSAGPGPSQGYQGAAPRFRQAMSMGFPTNRDYNTSKSAKDAFAVLANAEGVPAAPLQDKQALGAWFEQYIRPGMEDQGHKILSVDGDKFRFKNWQGTYDVDFGRGAGAEGGALDWMADDANAPQQTFGGAPSPLMSTGNSSAILQALLGGGDPASGGNDINTLLQLLMAGQSPF